MSRELLKEIAKVFRERRGGITWVAEPLLDKIETYLAQPEPEPVAWAIFRKGTMYDFSRTQPGEELLGQMGDYAIPVYTTPPDQSAQISELIAQRTLQESIIKSAYTSCRELEERLATLQAKREPLSDDEIRECAESENLPYFENKEEFDAFARAIEAAHGIKGE